MISKNPYGSQAAEKLFKQLFDTELSLEDFTDKQGIDTYIFIETLYSNRKKGDFVKVYLKKYGQKRIPTVRFLESKTLRFYDINQNNIKSIKFS